MKVLGPTPDQDRALRRLVDQGALSAEQMAHVRASLWGPAQPLQSGAAALLIEAAAYVGGGLIVGAAMWLVGLNDETLTRQGTVLVLIGYALALVVAAVAVAGGPHRVVGLRARRSPIRRRLVGVLLAASSGPAALAAGIAVATDHVAASGLTGLIVAALGYALLPTVPGLLTTVGMSALAAGGLLELDRVHHPLVPTIVYVGLGLAWIVLSALRAVVPRHLGLALGAGVTIAGAQLSAGTDETFSWAYALTIAVAGLCFVLYWLERATVLLASGVVAATIAVPEAVTDWTGDALSGPVILSIAGVVVIATSGLGLWLRSTRIDSAPEPEPMSRHSAAAPPAPRPPADAQEQVPPPAL